MSVAPEDPAARLYSDATHGDATAAMELLQRYLPRLRAFVRSRLGPELRARESHSDIVQSVCRELIEDKGCFRYHGETEFRGWLFTAALNKIREKVRHHHMGRRDLTREETSTLPATPTPDSRASPSYAALAKERLTILEAALDTLSEGEREVIALARLAGLPMTDVAGRLGKSVEATRKQLGRALLRLGAELKRSLTDG